MDPQRIPSPLASTTQSPPAQWLTEHEVAERTGLSVSTLRKHRFERRGIAYSKIGRSVRCLGHDVDTFMLANRIDLGVAK